MDSQKQQVAQRVKEANNILVTVSANPSVDQLAACIGLTLALNKMGKHATAVFSGEVPSILEFLQPEKTIEKNTDSLRDFIIALDKSKADKLRYKVEDRVVKIFITPYRTSLSDKDLEFSQGDFNIDVILALGVHNQSDLDQAITAHGRILHDATVVTLNNRPGGELGNMNWLDPTASSLSELAMQLLDMLDNQILDEQIATAMLTGIVAETERFSNAKTTPRTMSISAELMTAGANQQLVASKLEEPVLRPEPTAAPQHDQPAAEAAKPAKKSEDGTLEITHDEEKTSGPDAESTDAPSEDHGANEKGSQEYVGNDSAESVSAPAPPQIHIDEHGSISPLDKSKESEEPKSKNEFPEIKHHSDAPKMVLEPPTLGGQLTASGMPDAYELLPSDPLTLPAVDGQPDHLDRPSVAPTIMPPVDSSESGKSTPPVSMPDPSPAPEPVDQKREGDVVADMPLPDKTLSEIERDVHSSHLNEFNAPANDPVSGGQPAPAFAAGNPLSSPSFGAPDPSPAPNEANEAPAATPDPATDVQSARDAVAEAINNSSSNQPLPPIQALNAQPLDLPVGDSVASGPAPVMPGSGMPLPANDLQAQQLPADPQYGPQVAPAPTWSVPGQPQMPQYAPDLATHAEQTPMMFPGTPQGPAPSLPPTGSAQPQVNDPNAPPQVPPPFMPPTFR